MAFEAKLKAKDDKSYIKVYYPLDDELAAESVLQEQNIPNTGLNCVSIDIGIKNFAIRREVRYPNGKVVPVFHRKLSFNGEKESGSASVNSIVIFNANNFLNDIFYLHIVDADLVVIERQLAKSPKNRSMFDLVLNYMMSRIDSFTKNVVICDLNPCMKSKVLAPGERMTSTELKKWSISYALELLERRRDQWSVALLLYHKGSAKTKADDLADTIIQLEALYQYANR